MKIDQPDGTTYANQPASTTPSQSFEQCLKPKSGDEYYLLHQDQLEQSALHFESQIQTNNPDYQSPEQNTFNKAPQLQKQPTPPQKQTCIETPKQLTTQHPQSSLIKTTIEDLDHQLTQILNCLALTPAPIKSENPSQNSEPIQANKHLNTSFIFNNHHLFIKGQFAELTLNTHNLNPKQQKQLTQLIISTLKQKGLLLSSLIINGVTQ